MWRLAFYLILTVLLVTGCTESQPLPTLVPTNTPIPSTPTITPLPTPSPLPSVIELTRAEDPSQQAFVRVIHAAPTVPTIDIFIERLAIGTNMNFTTTTESAGLVAGEHFLRVVERGGQPDSGEYLLETPLNLNGGDRLLLLFTGTPDDLRMTTYPDSLAPLDGGQSRVTFINAFAPGVSIRQNGGDLIPALDFAQAAAPATLPAALLDLSFYSGDSQIISHPIQFRERRDYTVILAGTVEEPAVIETSIAVSGRASVRMIHASAPIGAVDVYVDGGLFAGGLEYTRATERQLLPSGFYNISIYPRDANPDETTPISTHQISANDDMVVSFIIIGTPQELRLVTYREDMSPTAPDEARVAFINTLSDFPRVRVDTQVGPLEEISDLSYGREPAVTHLPLINYTFFWNTVQGDALEHLEFADNVQFEAGRSYLYLSTGRDDNQPFILSERVGISETVASAPDEDELPLDPVAGPPQIRFIHAVMNSPPLDLVVEGELTISRVEFGQSSLLTITTTGDRELEAVASGTTDIVANFNLPLETGSVYTVIAYGEDTNNARLAIASDASVTISGDSVSIRLLNASSDADLRFGLAYSPTTAPGSSVFAVPPDTESLRRSVTIGMERVIAIRDIEPGILSPVGIAPAGLYSIHILDTQREPTTVAGTINGVALEAGGHYDVIAWQEIDSPLVQAFIVARPPDSD